MAMERFAQLVGETRAVGFDLSDRLACDELVATATVEAETLTGIGAATVSGAAVSADRKGASCLVTPPAAGTWLLTCTCRTDAQQTLLVTALIEVAPKVLTGRYATAADLQARFGSREIEDLDEAAGTRIARALEDAAAEIDSRISERYSLPLPDGDWPLLRSVACDLARARLYDDAALEEPQRLLKEARRTLDLIAKGDRRLVDDDGAEAPIRLSIQRIGPSPVMTKEGLRYF